MVAKKKKKAPAKSKPKKPKKTPPKKKAEKADEWLVEDAHPDPGGRVSGESDAAFLAFTCYRDSIQPRTIAKAWRSYALHRSKGKKKLGANPSDQFKRWCSKNIWRERVAAWDEHVDSVRRSQKIAAIVEAEDIMVLNAKFIMEAAVEKALEGDPRATKDLLDRLGVKRTPSESEASKLSLSMNYTSITTKELIAIVQQIKGG